MLKGGSVWHGMMGVVVGVTMRGACDDGGCDDATIQTDSYSMMERGDYGI